MNTDDDGPSASSAPAAGVEPGDRITAVGKQKIDSPEELQAALSKTKPKRTVSLTVERDGKTIFRLTESGLDWADGNTLAVQHIFPGGCIGLDSDPELLEIARNTVAALARWKCGNGFPTFYTAAVRVGHDPDEILRHLHERVGIRTEQIHSVTRHSRDGGCRAHPEE